MLAGPLPGRPLAPCPRAPAQPLTCAPLSPHAGLLHAQLLAVLDKHGSASGTGGLPDSEQDGGREWDLIFVDICMQRSNGEDVCRRLRAAGVRTPLVAATGNAVREDLERYTAAGFSTVMLKPFNGTTVADMLRSLLVTKA